MWKSVAKCVPVSVDREAGSVACTVCRPSIAFKGLPLVTFFLFYFYLFNAVCFLPF